MRVRSALWQRRRPMAKEQTEKKGTLPLRRARPTPGATHPPPSPPSSLGRVGRLNPFATRWRALFFYLYRKIQWFCLGISLSIGPADPVSGFLLTRFRRCLPFFFCVVSFLAIFLFSPRTKRSNDVGEGKKSKVIPGMLGMLGIHPRAARAQNST